MWRLAQGMGLPGAWGGIREMHGEYILTERWECVPSPFTTRSGTHRSLRYPSSLWPLLFEATENNNQYRANMCLRGRINLVGTGGGGEEDKW